MAVEVQADGRVAVVERSEVRIRLVPPPEPRDPTNERKRPVALPLLHGSSSVIAPGFSRHIDIR